MSTLIAILGWVLLCFFLVGVGVWLLVVIKISAIVAEVFDVRHENSIAPHNPYDNGSFYNKV